MKDKANNIYTTEAESIEDFGKTRMYSIRWVSWKDNYHEEKTIDTQITYPISDKDLESILNNGVTKIRIDTDREFLDYSRNDRFSRILKIAKEEIDKVLAKQKVDLYEGF